jgi:hypothetical protein
MTWPLIPSVDN